MSVKSVVDIGHMLGLDQEREELGRNHVCIDTVIHLLTMFVCINYYSIVILLVHKY